MSHLILNCCGSLDTVRTALVALIAFMPTKPDGALGSLDYTKEERRILAIKSRNVPPKFGTAERQTLIDEVEQNCPELVEYSVQNVYLMSVLIKCQNAHSAFLESVHMVLVLNQPLGWWGGVCLLRFMST
jgi:hypothetical protein